MFKNPLLLIALALTGLIATWGIIDTAGLTKFSSTITGTMFTSRGWFVMLSASLLLVLSIWLAISPYGKIKLGKDDDEPEFSTVSWLSMLFAAGMGVGLLFWGTAEPLSHFKVVRNYTSSFQAAGHSLFVTIFHWGLHAWAIYAVTGLVMAYFSFRQGYPNLVSAPMKAVFGERTWTKSVGWLSDLLAIYAIAIGIGGSIAMGVFQLQSGVESLFGLHNSGLWLAGVIFAVLCLACILPLMMDLSKGMATLSNTAIAIAGGLMIFVLLTGPTYYIMSGITESIGHYFARVLPQGFRTYTFFDEKASTWFQSWTLTFMVWWFAWAPFVGVFIARISRGRTIREYIVGVILVPTFFSIFWFGVFGSVGFYEVLELDASILEVVKTNINDTTFFVLRHLPLSTLTIVATVLAAFLFVVTSVVSASFVLSMFSTGGDLNPPTRTKLIWGVILGALGLVMILSNSIDAVKSIIALAALPFINIVLLVAVCLLKALKSELVQ
ncbi:MAG: BCCT family transporter [Deltaproteobacteria bacterium]|nr:MAG: BCCT family transporter [Deltaproteobacteria bacterium]